MRSLTNRLTGLFFVGLLIFALAPSPGVFAQSDEELEQSFEDLTDYLTKNEKERKKPKFSKKDIKKMQELGQLPVVKRVIENVYAAVKKSHQDQAYRQNVATGRDSLYQHPVLQEYINDLGQSLVPEISPNLYTFRVIYDPRPNSFALSTGSIYVTTGMLSLLENEAQLAYLLGHEIAHVEQSHFYERIRGQLLEHALNIEKQKSAKKKSAIFGVIAGAAGAAVGGSVGGWQTALGAGTFASLGTYGVASAITGHNARPKYTSWDEVEERSADEFGLQVALKANYDVREATKFLATLEKIVKDDPRVGLAFHRNNMDLSQRRQHLQTVLTGTLKEELAEKAQGELVGTSPNFHLLMASVRRDNGIRALDYDLFQLARQNLEQAISIRSSDPSTQYYLGKVYRLTARNSEERQKAKHHFLQAIRYDSKRSFYPDPHLDLALSMIREEDPKLYAEIQKELKIFVTLYQRKNGGALPRNMSFIYDYLSMTGEDTWSVPTVVNVSTREPATPEVDFPPVGGQR